MIWYKKMKTICYNAVKSYYEAALENMWDPYAKSTNTIKVIYCIPSHIIQQQQQQQCQLNYLTDEFHSLTN